MVLLVKEVKPQRFKEEAFQRVIRNALIRYSRIVLKDFERTVATWDHKPKFIVKTHATARTPSPSLEVYTTDEIYGYVDGGTKAHDIWAGAYTGKSDKKTLAFPSMFSPKTKPNVIGSSAGSKGGETVMRPFVEHPGTKARNFSKIIEKQNEKPFQVAMQKAMAEAAKESGHAI